MRFLRWVAKHFGVLEEDDDAPESTDLVLLRRDLLDDSLVDLAGTVGLLGGLLVMGWDPLIVAGGAAAGAAVLGGLRYVVSLRPRIPNGRLPAPPPSHAWAARRRPAAAAAITSVAMFALGALGAALVDPDPRLSSSSRVSTPASGSRGSAAGGASVAGSGRRARSSRCAPRRASSGPTSCRGSRARGQARRAPARPARR